MPGLDTAAARLGIRPENIGIGAAGAGHIDARVDVVERLGSDTYVYALVDDATPVTARRPGNARRYAVGETIGLIFDPAQLHVFAADGRAISPS